MNRPGLLTSICLTALVAASCSGSSKKLDLGGQCVQNSDCNNPLSCKFATCHQQCVVSRDCPTGQLCVAAADGVGVCQTPTEAACGTGKQVCGGSLVCYANSTCVNACPSTGKCPLTSQTCVNGAYCLGPELANNDAGAAGAGGGADAGVGGAADAGVAGAAGTGGALDASSLDSLDGGGGGGLPQQCLTSFVNPFAALTPYWANWSNSTCGSAVASNGNLVLTQNEPCGTAAPDVTEGLTEPYVLCGDFDVQVSYALTGFGAAPVGGMFASLRVDDPAAPLTGMTMERYVASYLPSSNSYQNYKSYTDNSGNDATSVILATSDTTGRLRITRTGTTVSSYYWKVGATDAGTGQWVLVKTATLTSTPWVVLLYAGDNSAASSGPAASYSVTFSNLQVTSPGPTDAGTGIGPLADSGASDAPDTAITADANAVDAPVGSDAIGGTGGSSNTGGAGQGGVTTGGATGTGGSAGYGGTEETATLFIPDYLDSVIYRYNITRDADPVLTATIVNNSAYAPAVRSTGELFVANYLASGTISRFLSPLGNPVTNGTIANVDITYPDTMLFVDDELWVPNTAPDCSTGAASLVRLAFDSQGNASAVGTVTSGLIGANRGMAWGPTTRDLFISQCNTPYTVQHYRVASDHTVTMLTPITGNGIYNPGGMVVAPWGELLVSNEGTASSTIHGSSILRFSIDAQGNVTPNGTITGNGMDSPWGLAFTPWGELIVCNNTAATLFATLSRFTFDASHAATPNGTFRSVAHQDPGFASTASITIVPGASTPVAASQWTGSGANGHYYEIANAAGTNTPSYGGLSWTEASSLAQAKGGYLATITSAAENAFVAALLEASSADRAWFGGSDAAVEGTWVWVVGPESGTNFSYTNWYSGEPNNNICTYCASGGPTNPQGEDYAEMYSTRIQGTSGQWNDLPNAGTPGIGYVVEYDTYPGD